MFTGRAEQWQNVADIVTMRAVEQFERALPAAAALVAPGGKLCLLIGARQGDAVRRLLGDWTWTTPVTIPQSDARVVLVGHHAGASSPAASK